MWVDPFFDFLNRALIGYILVIEKFGPTKHKAINCLLSIFHINMKRRFDERYEVTITIHIESLFLNIIF